MKEQENEAQEKEEQAENETEQERATGKDGPSPHKRMRSLGLIMGCFSSSSFGSFSYPFQSLSVNDF